MSASRQYRFFLPAAVGVCAVMLFTGGCAKDAKVSDPFKGVLTNPFAGPSEAGFMALVRANCSQYHIGQQSLGALLKGNTEFQALTEALYRGNISNDEYIDRVLSRHQAPDANILGTGCVINQLDECLSSSCELKPTQSAPPAKPAASTDGSAEGSDAASMDGHPSEPETSPAPLP